MLRKIKYPLVITALSFLFLTLLWMNVRQRAFLESIFGQEIHKMNYQFIVVIILGGFVGALYRMWSKSEEKLLAERTERNRVRRQYFSNLNRAVNRLLKLKFETDAKVVQDNKTVLHKEYHLIMNALTNLMLRFQTLQKAIELRKSELYGELRGVKVVENLKKAVAYLNDIVIEYDLKSNIGLWKGDPLNCPLDELKFLKEFYLAQAPFRTNLAEPLDSCLSELQDAALKSETQA